MSDDPMKRLQRLLTEALALIDTLAEPGRAVVVSEGKPPAQRGARLPAGWVPPSAVVAEMKAECPGIDLRREHRKFVDYWAGVPGQRGVKLDWVATWRNWIRKSAEAPGSRTGVLPGTDEKVMGWLALGAYLD